MRQKCNRFILTMRHNHSQMNAKCKASFTCQLTSLASARPGSPLVGGSQASTQSLAANCSVAGSEPPERKERPKTASAGHTDSARKKVSLDRRTMYFSDEKVTEKLLVEDWCASIEIKK